MTQTERMVEFATNYAAAWSSGDPDSVASFFAEDASLSINGGEPSIGRNAIAEDARNFMTAFPDINVSFDVLIPTDLGSEFHWTLSATHSETGNRVSVRGFELWRMGPDGLIAESKGYFDAEEYARQVEQGR